MVERDPLSQLTAREEKLRDRILGPVVCWLPGWVKPNHLTLGRGGLVVAAVILKLFVASASLTLQAALLLVAAATDSVDGTLARLRGQTSWLGSFLDSAVDWCAGVWMAVLVIWLRLLTYWVAVVLAAAQGIIMATDRLRRPRRGPQGRPGDWPPWQHTALARLQGVGVIVGCFLLLVGADQDAAGVQVAGQVMVWMGAALALTQAGWGLTAVAAGRKRRLDGSRNVKV